MMAHQAMYRCERDTPIRNPEYRLFTRLYVLLILVGAEIPNLDRSWLKIRVQKLSEKLKLSRLDENI